MKLVCRTSEPAFAQAFAGEVRDFAHRFALIDPFAVATHDVRELDHTHPRRLFRAGYAATEPQERRLLKILATRFADAFERRGEFARERRRHLRTLRAAAGGEHAERCERRGARSQRNASRHVPPITLAPAVHHAM